MDGSARLCHTSLVPAPLTSVASSASTSKLPKIHPSNFKLQRLLDEDRFGDFSPLLPASLLPLPRTRAGRGHRHRQRQQWKRSIIEEANNLLRSLNSLDSGMPSTSRTTCRHSASSSLPAVSRHSASSSVSASTPASPATRRLHRLVQSLAASAVQERLAACEQLSGAQVTSQLIKADRVDRYSFAINSHSQIPFKADLLVEPPPDAPVVDLLDALPIREKSFYAEESNVVRNDFYSGELFKSLETQFAFLGGSLEEYLKYLHRAEHLW